MPAATGQVMRSESADQHLQAIVAGYTRAALDRGGWHNAIAPADHYAAREPLPATAVGSGVTTPGRDAEPPQQRLAAL